MELLRRVVTGCAVLAGAGALAGPAAGASVRLVPQDSAGVVPATVVTAPGGVAFRGSAPGWDGSTIGTAGTVAAGAATAQLVDAPPGSRTTLAPGSAAALWRLQGPARGSVLPHAVLLAPESGAPRFDTAVDVDPAVPSASMAVDARARLWIGDGHADRLVRVKAEEPGTVVSVPLGYRRSHRQRERPLLLAVATADRVWVVDGDTVSLASAAGVQRRARLPFRAQAIARDAAGALWALGRAGRLARVTHAGRVRAQRTGLLPRPGTIVAGPRGHLWLNVPGTDRLLELTPAGRLTEHRLRAAAGPANAVPRTLALGGDGRLWALTPAGLAVAEVGRARVGAATTVRDPATGCRFPMDATVLARSSEAALAARDLPAGDGRVVWSCTRRGGQVRRLLHTVDEDGEPQASSFLLRGTHVAYVTVAGSHYGDGAIVLHALDLADPRSSRSVRAGELAPFGPAAGDYWFDMPGPALADDGTLAWIDGEGADAHVRVLRPGAAAPETIATGAWGTLHGIAVEGRTVAWTENGAPRSATI